MLLQGCMPYPQMSDDYTVGIHLTSDTREWFSTKAKYLAKLNGAPPCICDFQTESLHLTNVSSVWQSFPHLTKNPHLSKKEQEGNGPKDLQGCRLLGNEAKLNFSYLSAQNIDISISSYDLILCQFFQSIHWSQLLLLGIKIMILWHAWVTVRK